MSAAIEVHREGGGPLVAIGVDAGSTTTKAVGVDAAGRLVLSALTPASPRVAEHTAAMIAALTAEAGASSRAGDAGDVAPRADVPVVATGYGRKLVTAAGRTVTEITCHAKGVHADLGTAGTLVDIGGQDSKVIRIGGNGAPVDFAMNDKCAAGTGRFLEHTAQRLGVELTDLGTLTLSAHEAAPVSSTCTVFAESEVISLVAHGREVPDILLGLHEGLISRVAGMVRGVGLMPPLFLSGGVARNAAVGELLGRQLGTPVRLPRFPQLMGAYGAALLAADAASGDEGRPADPRHADVPRACAGCVPEGPEPGVGPGQGRLERLGGLFRRR